MATHGETVFKCADVEKGTFEFSGILPLQNFANLYSKQKGLVQYKTGQSTNDSMVIPKSTKCQHGLIATVEESYNRHIGLELSAEDFWIAISQVVSMYLSDRTNAEKYRQRFVNHEGQKELIVFTNSDTTGEWVRFVDEIAHMIEGNMNPDFVELMTTPFSSTTRLELTVFKISLMEAAQHYFKYTCFTLCGIPEVCIKGTVSDFEEIKRRLKGIGTLLGGLKWWTDKITDTMDKIVETLHGKQDLDWWKSIVTIDWGMSGKPAHMSGWICDFIPFAKTNDGKTIPNYGELDWMHLNPGLTYTPVHWENLVTGEKAELRLCAGFLGVAADGETKRLKPAKGWMLFKEKDT